MYRQYEDPRRLERELERVEEEYQRFLEDGGVDDDGYWYERISDLKERINFAWQDEEYDENYMRESYGDEEWMQDNVYSAEDASGHHFYKITLGTGTAWVDTFIIETEDATTDYGALTDILIDFLRSEKDYRILDPSAYEYNEDDSMYNVNHPNSVIYPDEFVIGGNYGDILEHYGVFDIEEIPESELEEDYIYVPEVW